MKKVLLAIGIIIVVAALYFAWVTFGTATTFSSKPKYLLLYDNQPVKQQAQQQLNDSNYINHVWWFNILARQAGVWDRLKPGRFAIEPGQSVLDVVRTLRNNKQSPVRLVITKLRTANDFAKVIGRNFSTDSIHASLYFNSNDSLQQLGVDTNTLMTLVIPDTYVIYWNTSLTKIMRRLEDEKDKFWSSDNRLQKADAAGLTPVQIVTVASIVEEETNKAGDKGKIASVYINRYRSGQPLQADPTVKFALKNFGLKRILHGHLNVVSPYNTYRNKGLPPGPICTPSVKTIDAVLNAPKTGYYYFVAKSDFSGYSHFSANYAEHTQYARMYQQALDSLIKSRQSKYAIMTKIERIFVTASPIVGIRNASKKLTLPGFRQQRIYNVFHMLAAQIKQNGLNIRASAISFNIITAIPAITLFLCILVPYVPGSKQVYDQLLVFIRDFTPNNDTKKALTDFLNDFFNKKTTGLLSFSFVLVLFTSSNAMMGIIRTFDRSVTEKRKTNFLKKRLRAIRLIITLVSLLLGTILISVGQGYVFAKLMRWANIKNEAVIALIQNSRWLVILFLFIYTIGYIYKHAPTAKVKSRLFTPGAFFASVLMIIITGLFSYWAQNISSYNKIYGSIGSLIILMLLVFLNSMMLLIGYELNVSIAYLDAMREREEKES